MTGGELRDGTIVNWYRADEVDIQLGMSGRRCPEHVNRHGCHASRVAVWGDWDSVEWSPANSRGI